VAAKIVKIENQIQRTALIFFVKEYLLKFMQHYEISREKHKFVLCFLPWCYEKETGIIGAGVSLVRRAGRQTKCAAIYAGLGRPEQNFAFVSYVLQH